MKLSLEWADSLNIAGTNPEHPNESTIEQILSALGSPIAQDDMFAIYNEQGPNTQTLGWRLSTVLGIYLTEAIAHAQYDTTKGSLIYNDAKNPADQFARELNNLNIQNFSTPPEWVPRTDPNWNLSIPSFDQWAMTHGYTEMGITVERFGYGWGFRGIAVKLAMVVLLLHAVLALGHVIFFVGGGKTFNSWSTTGEMLALAWNSNPTDHLRNTSAGIGRTATWQQIIPVREMDGERLELVLKDSEQPAWWKPREHIKYA